MRVEGLGINGAIIASIVSQIISTAICFVILKRSTNIRIKINKFLFKPIIATIGMALVASSVYMHLSENMFSTLISFFIAMLLSGIIYLVLILSLRIFSIDEISMLPYGEKAYKILEKFKKPRTHKNQ